MRAKDDSTDRGNCCFSYIQSFLDEGRTQHEKRGEATENDVDQMRSVDREVVPRHFAVEILVLAIISCMYVFDAQ